MIVLLLTLRMVLIQQCKLNQMLAVDPCHKESLEICSTEFETRLLQQLEKHWGWQKLADICGP